MRNLGNFVKIFRKLFRSSSNRRNSIDGVVGSTRRNSVDGVVGSTRRNSIDGVVGSTRRNSVDGIVGSTRRNSVDGDTNVELPPSRRPKEWFCHNCRGAESIDFSNNAPWAFRRRWQLLRHISREHKNDRFKCDYCDSKFSTAEERRDHIREMNLGCISISPIDDEDYDDDNDDSGDDDGGGAFHYIGGWENNYEELMDMYDGAISFIGA